MRKLLCIAMLLVFGNSALAQNQPCDEVINSGETNCIYSVVGTDSCPTLAEAPSVPCPTGCGRDAWGWYCQGPLPNTSQSIGLVNLNTGATAPKWSAPPPGQMGWTSTITSAIACAIYYECECKVDPNHPFDPFNPLAAGTCESKQCGLAMLWTLAKTPTPPGQPAARCVTSALE